MNIWKVLKIALEKWAADVILTSWFFPSLKLYWEVYPLEEFWIIEAQEMKEKLYQIMNKHQQEEFEKTKEVDFSIEFKGFSRFRVNIFEQKNWMWAVMRVIPSEIPNFKDLDLPDTILDFAHQRNWLVLVTWSVGSGKSTTLSSLINEINKTEKKHIITVEDPIEFIYKNDKSIVEQREVWENTETFESWLKYALRQAPDVILVWEMRDLETFKLALRAAETGNLVFATLHTSWAARTVSRIIDMFPWDEKEQIRQQLSESLLWVVWQALLKTADWKGRVAAVEVLKNTTTVANMIRKDVTHQIDNAIETWAWDWMITMRNYLEELFNKWKISEESYETHLKQLTKS